MPSVAEIFTKAKDHLRAIAGEAVAIIKKGQDKLSKDIKSLEKTTKENKTDTKPITRGLKGVERAVKGIKEHPENVSVNNLEEVTAKLDDIVSNIKSLNTEVNINTDLTRLEELAARDNTEELVIELRKIQAGFSSIVFPKSQDNTAELESIKEAILSKTNEKIESLLAEIKDKELSVQIPETMDVELDPNLIEDDRIRVVLRDDQVAKIGEVVQSNNGNTAESSLAINQDPLGRYQLANFDCENTPIYIGKIDVDGKWFIKKIDMNLETAEFVKGDEDFDSNWFNRESQSYDIFNNIF